MILLYITSESDSSDPDSPEVDPSLLSSLLLVLSLLPELLAEEDEEALDTAITTTT